MTYALVEPLFQKVINSLLRIVLFLNKGYNHEHGQREFIVLGMQAPKGPQADSPILRDVKRDSSLAVVWYFRSIETFA